MMSPGGGGGVMTTNDNKNKAKKTPAQGIDSADGFIYQVHFKRAHKNFVIPSHSSLTVQINDVVRVEADRGEDVGTVVSKIPLGQFQEAKRTAGFRGRG
jgi:phospholipid N-methyltransferase